MIDVLDPEQPEEKSNVRIQILIYLFCYYPVIILVWYETMLLITNEVLVVMMNRCGIE